MSRTGGALHRDEVLGLLERYLEPNDPILYAALAVFRHEDMVYIGSCILTKCCELEEDAPEIGFIVHPDHQGRGHATRMARCLIELAREHLEAPRVFARVARDHAASIRVLEKAGMKSLRPCGAGMSLYSA